jgi:serine/threonine-protein kinase RsbT
VNTLASGSACEQGTVAQGVTVRVDSELDVRDVISAANRFCVRHDFSPLFAAHVATAASELANNLWMHALLGGRICLGKLDDGHRAGVELLSEDDGPGIADIELAMREGYSTGGGLGCGLPGVQRLMDEFSIDSGIGRGTLVRAVKWMPARR